MNILLAFIIIIASAKNAVEGSDEAGLRATFNMGLTGMGESFMYNLPRNKSDADGWVETTAPEGIEEPYSILTLLCYPGNFVCILYDENGLFAGIQTSYPKANVTNAAFNLTKQGFRTWTLTENGVSVEYWYTRVYTISKDDLQNTSAKSRLAAYDSTRTLQYDGIWITGIDGELVYVSKNVTEIENNSNFTKQGCFIWMGRHYYYNMTSATPALSEYVLPYFIYTNGEEIIGFAPYIVCELTVGSGYRSYFENPNKLAVQMIVPDGPQWLYDYAEDSMIHTLHFYLINDPRWILCIGY